MAKLMSHDSHSLAARLQVIWLPPASSLCVTSSASGSS
eukprot:CAMPEP_0177201594 /NCGR_PEP_ID=MMETSP0367-20130122/26834_1 /TAXON_ID=447022 ORGANISM="Scrippsiella hangoei-like, Strain SHHI-4" /NCGR_SAMPLE_ID=MMETSP0367 /ASSEMBLY_ACC=CAM_ASM_000362 /LENGTH=37 /DNA_ID= /DNA_START= /DNA_END= /DNA_ORIENTATION=